MSFRNVRTIYRKEILDTLRDRRTLIAMIGVPIVLYPAILLLAGQVFLVQQERIEARASRVAVIGPGAQTAETWLQDAENIEIVDTENPDAAFARGEINAIVDVTEDAATALTENESVSVRVAYNTTKSASQQAARRVQDRLEEVAEDTLDARLSAQGLDRAFVEPVAVELDDVAPPEQRAGSALGRVIPLLMVLMLGVGAFYPAVDLTAGEKERGTFETLLSTPATKRDIVFGKFGAVFTYSIITAALNLASMLAAIAFQFRMVNMQTGGESVLSMPQVPWDGVLYMALTLVPLAVLVAAVMMGVALLARNVKDAANLVTPFFLAIIFPASLAAVPDIELTRATQFIPIANVALLFRDLLLDEATVETVFTVFTSTAVYALVALLTAAGLFHRDEVILAEDRGAGFNLRRRDWPTRDVPTPAFAVALLAIIMVLIFYAGSYLQARNLIVGLLITEYALILTPVLFALWLFRIGLRSALNLRAPSLPAVVAAAAITAGWLVIIIQVSVWHNKVLPVPPEFAEALEGLLRGEDALNLAGLLLVLAVTPAICEEVLFRGAFFTGLRNRVPDWMLVILVGIAFGAFHLSIYRFVPTGFSGIVLAYLVLRSGSIWIGMGAHAFINGASVLLETGAMPEAVTDLIRDPAFETRGFPVLVLAVAAALAASGVLLLEWQSRRRHTRA